MVGITRPAPPIPSESLIVRFWSKVDRRGPDDCWRWTKGSGGRGRGTFYLGTQDGRCRNEEAHRVAFWLSKDYWPHGREVCHTCDVPLCCNPAHLFAGTHAENMADMARKGRGAKPTPKITHADRAEMRRLFASGECSRLQLARRYGVSFTLAQRYVPLSEDEKRPPFTRPSGVTGIYWLRGRKRWRVLLFNNGARTYVGMYRDLDVAKQALQAARQEVA